MVGTRYVDLAASTAQTVAVTSGEPVLDEIADAPDRLLTPGMDTLEVINVDGSAAAYFTYDFARGFNAASAGAIPVAPTIAGAGTIALSATPGEFVRIRAPREHNIAVVRVISAGTPRIGVSALGHRGERDVDPDAGGGGGSHDYVPFAFDANTDDPDTVILALADLFAYYPMDDASGLIQDASGNANHASSSSGTRTYAQSPLTSKVGNSIQFDGGHFVIPKPGGIGDMTTDAAEWTMFWLERISAYVGTGSTGNTAVPRILMGQSGSGAAALLLGTVAANGDDLYTVVANRASIIPDLLPLSETMLVAMTKQPDVSGASHVDLSINGVPWTSMGAVTTGNNNLTVGRSDDGFWGWSTHRMSNLATLERALTLAELKTVAEALLDTTAFAAALVP